jgi:hypothetical protein
MTFSPINNAFLLKSKVQNKKNSSINQNLNISFINGWLLKHH